MFGTILHANDGSESAFRALALALEIARQNATALHIVCVEEVPYMPEYIEDVREETRTAGRRFHGSCRRRADWRSGIASNLTSTSWWDTRFEQSSILRMN